MPSYSDNVQFRKQADNHMKDKDGTYAVYIVEKVEERGGGTAFDIRRLTYNTSWRTDVYLLGYMLARLLQTSHNDEMRNIIQPLMDLYTTSVGPFSSDINILPFGKDS